MRRHKGGDGVVLGETVHKTNTSGVRKESRDWKFPETRRIEFPYSIVLRMSGRTRVSFTVKPLRAKSSAVIDCRDILVLYRLRYSDWMIFS